MSLICPVCRPLIAHRLSSLLICSGDHWSFFRASIVLQMFVKLFNSVHDFDGDILGKVVQVIQKLFEVSIFIFSV